MLTVKTAFIQDDEASLWRDDYNQISANYSAPIQELVVSLGMNY